MANPLRIGPMTPDDYGAAASGLRVDARALIAAGESAYPPALRAAMSRRTDEVASEALDLGALSGELGVEVVAASVRGFPGEEQILVYLFREESGRTGRWYAPLGETSAEGMAQQAHQEADKADEEAREHQNRLAGLDPDAEPGPDAQAPQSDSGPDPEGTPESPQERTDEALAEEREQADQQPWPGYDSETVAEIQDRLSQSDGALKARVAEYEAAHKNRKGVLDSTEG